MVEKTDKLKKEIRSLTFKLPFHFVLSGVLIVLLVIPIVYYRFQQRMISEYTRMAQGVTNLMAGILNVDRMDEYMEKNHELPEYNEILRQFHVLKENYPDVRSMYVYQIMPDGGHVIFDLDGAEQGIDEPGAVCQLDEAFRSYREELCKGEQIPAVTARTKEGYLLTYFRPVMNRAGEYQCHVCVDFSMDKIHDQDVSFIISILEVLSIAVGLVLLIDINMIRRRVTGPINKMVQHIKGFTYETEADRFLNVQIMEELNISTGDEIEDLYREFMSVMKESLFYRTSLNRAKNDIQNKENQIGQISATAFKDVLTGVGSHAAYDKAIEQLAKEIAEKKAQFAIVMADINNLKYVNDTYGHEMGDRYIRGCSAIICGIYKHSPVYRVGGDEFVVILKNEDYASRLLRLTKIREAFVGAYHQPDKEEWERYSASIGMAEFGPSDESAEQVLKRADKAMYEEKMAFKKKYGSYR